MSWYLGFYLGGAAFWYVIAMICITREALRDRELRVDFKAALWTALAVIVLLLAAFWPLLMLFGTALALFRLAESCRK